MAYCYICGDEHDLVYRKDIFKYACKSCSRDTPRKMSRESFDKKYWGEESDSVPESTKREFYEDYRAQGCSFAEYVRQTTNY